MKPPKPSASSSLTPEEYEANRISGPLSKQKFLAYLRKIGKLPPGGRSG